MALIDIARRIKAGVCLLDKRIPNWRHILRRYEDEFDFSDGEYCILGTLEHHSGRMRVLKARHKAQIKEKDDAFNRALAALNIDEPNDLGFDFGEPDDDLELDTFEALWRAEFEKTCKS